MSKPSDSSGFYLTGHRSSRFNFRRPSPVPLAQDSIALNQNHTLEAVSKWFHHLYVH